MQLAQSSAMRLVLVMAAQADGILVMIPSVGAAAAAGGR